MQNLHPLSFKDDTAAKATLRKRRCMKMRIPHLHSPKTRHGGDRKSKKAKNQDADSAPRSFKDDTAAKTNQSARTVAVDVQIATNIPEPIRDMIRDTSLADNKSELLQLARLDADMQAEVVDRICVRTIACPCPATAPFCVSSGEHERP